MQHRKRISPFVWTLGIILLLVLAVFVVGRLDFPGRILRALASLIPASQSVAEKTEDGVELRALVDRLQVENAILREMILNEQGVRAIEEARIDSDFPLLQAQVIYRDHARLFETAVIDRGSSDGVEVNMPVVDSRGLIGRVVSTRAVVSRIVLITSPDCYFGVRDQRSRELGIVRGSEPLKWWVGEGAESGVQVIPPDLLEFIYLSPSAEISVHDTLMTSGLSGITPPGIRVGEVVEIISREEQGRYEVRVRPFAAMEHLEAVAVVLFEEEERLELEELLEEVGDELGQPDAG